MWLETVGRHGADEYSANIKGLFSWVVWMFAEDNVYRCQLSLSYDVFRRPEKHSQV
jgi:hypothetical protein